MTAGRRHALLAVAVAVLSGAVLGWASGALFARDFLGETGRTVVVFGGGCSVGFACMSAHARKRGRGVLEGAALGVVAMVAGLCALAVAVAMVRVVYVYAAGTVPLWPILFCLALFVVVCVLGFVVLFNTIVVLVTVIPWRHASRAPASGLRRVAGELAAAVIILGFFAYMPEEGYHSLWWIAKAPRQSPWIESRRELFSEVLSGMKCEVLVAPMEAPGRSLDRVARDYLAWQTAAAIADSGASCVVDAGLARRALGENRRVLDADHVRALADAVGATRVVRSQATLRRDGATVDLSWSVETRPGNGPWQAGTTQVARRLSHRDATPAEAVVSTEFRAIASELGWRTGQQANSQTGPMVPRRDLPPTPEALVDDTGVPIDRAERLQLLAVFAPAHSVESREYWLRSLVALRNADAGDPTARALRARAWLHLGRREFAESLVRDVSHAEAQAVLGLTQGNLPDAERRAAGIASPLARLIHRIETEHLRSAYRSHEGQAQRREAQLATLPQYRAYLSYTLGLDDWWHWDTVAAVAAAIGVGEDGLQKRIRQVAEVVVGHWVRWIPPVAVDPAGAVESHFAPRWLAYAPAWRTVAPDRVSSRDLAEVLFAVNRAAAAHHLATRLDRQGLPNEALSEALSLAPSLRRDPWITVVATQAARRADGVGMTHVDGFLRDGAEVVAEGQFALEDAYSAVGIAYGERHGFAVGWTDEPLPAAWLARSARSLEKAGRDPKAARVLLERATRRTQTSFGHLWRAHDLAVEAGDSPGAERLLAENAGRFNGSDSRRSFERDRVGRWADPARECAFLDGRLASGQAEWATYSQAARCQLRLHLPSEARRRLDAWPRELDTDTVTASNRAAIAAEMFYRAGDFALAKRFADQSVATESGSWREMQAAAMSAVIARDWSAARSAYRASHERYDDAASLVNGAWMAGVGRDLRVAREELSIAARSQTDALPGRAAVAVARRAALDDAALREAILAWPGTAAPTSPHATWTRTWMAFEALVVDRAPGEADLAFLHEIAGPTSQPLHALARGYMALRADRPDVALKALLPLYPLTPKRRTDIRALQPDALPLLVEALVRTGRIDEAERLTDERRRVWQADSWFYLSRAVVEEATARRDQAAESLWQAFVVRDEDRSTVFPLPYALLDTLEGLQARSGDVRYRNLLVDVALRTAGASPSGWAYAFVALHASDSGARRSAAAAALALDPRSARLARLDAATLAEARRAVAEGDPFARTR